MQQTSEFTRYIRKNATVLDPQRLLKTLCFIVLAFIPINMLASPVLDYFVVEQRGENWTVTLSTFVFVVAAMPLLFVAALSLNARHEKLFFRCLIGFFLYAFLFTMYAATDLSYPIYGLVSALGTILVGTVFYVSVRGGIISHRIVVYSLIAASVFVITPLLLVQIDIERFARLSEQFGATYILYGYENPRAVGWVSTICLSLLAAHLSTQPAQSSIRPIFLLLVMMAATTLFWSGSRGGLIAFTVSICIVLTLGKTRNHKGMLSVLLCIAAGAAVSYFLYVPSVSYGMFGRISQSLEQDSIAAVGSGRVELWQTTISYILERPLTGYGYLPNKSLAGLSHGSAHNIVLDLWLWFGVIIGTLVAIFGIMLWAKVFAVFRKYDDHHVAALFCVVTTLLVYSMLSGPYARTFPLLIFAVTSGATLGLRRGKTT